MAETQGIYSGSGGAKPQEIIVELNILGEIIEQLSKEIETLAGRIQPVLSQPTPQIDSDAPPKEVEVTSSLALELRGHRDKIKNNINTIVSMARRVEL